MERRGFEMCGREIERGSWLSSMGLAFSFSSVPRLKLKHIEREIECHKRKHK